MGNRCVITTRDNFNNNGVGVYLHWNGGRDSVDAFLKYCKLRGFRTPEQDCYGWSRLCQVIGNFFGGDCSVGIDTIDNLDCDNGDNGVYLIENWEVVGRKYTGNYEQNEYDIDDLVKYIDSRQPEFDRLGDYLNAKPVSILELKLGDEVYFDTCNGKGRGIVIGFGTDRTVNGDNVLDVPFVNAYCSDSCSYEDNINNYLFGNKSIRLVVK